MHPKKLRLFLAVPAILEHYGKIKHNFDTLVEGRWTPEQQLHATLCFFGTRFETPELFERLEKIDFSTEASDITSLGFFKRSNILYAESTNASLERLYRDVNAELELSSRRPLTPHVTLMRVKRIVDRRAFFDQLDHYQNRPLGRLENRIALFSSELHSEGARYSLLKEWKT